VPARGVEIAVWLVGLAVAAVEALAARARSGGPWGGDAYAFLPAAAWWCGLGAAVVLASLAIGRSPGPPTARTLGRTLGVGPVLIGAAVVFWVFRIRHVLLGDGIPIAQLLPDVHEIHPREPLASLLQQGFYRVLEPVFARPDVPRAIVVRDCVAVGSVLAGVVFVLVARLVAREIVRTFPASEPEDERPLAWALALALLGQGYVQMFFGYVENYAYPMVIAALFVATSLRFLRGAGSLRVPLAAAALGVAFDFTGVVLGPAILVLVGCGLLDPARRRATVRDGWLALGLTAAAIAWLAWGPPHYPVVTHLAAMLASGRAGADYLFSPAHLRDFLNEHLLLGPFGLFLFVPAALLLGWRRARPSASGLFLLVAGLSVCVACWSTPDLPLGYARDWDLFAPLAVVLTAAALGLGMALLTNPTARWRMAALIVVVSLFHTLPWIALNTSEARSLRRFETLPLGGGRTESTVAFWHAERRDFPEAKRWLSRALAIDPRNSRALDLVGRIAFEEHHPRLALQAYLIAVTLRPDKPDYRQQLAVALTVSGGPEAGLRQLDTLTAGHPEDGAVWFERTMLLRAAGRPSEAIEARARALALRPDLAVFADSLPVAPPR